MLYPGKILKKPVKGLSGFPEEQGHREIKIVEYSFVLRSETAKCGNDCAMLEFLDVVDLRYCGQA